MSPREPPALSAFDYIYMCVTQHGFLCGFWISEFRPHPWTVNSVPKEPSQPSPQLPFPSLNSAFLQQQTEVLQRVQPHPLKAVNPGMCCPGFDILTLFPQRKVLAWRKTALAGETTWKKQAPGRRHTHPSGMYVKP